MPQYKLAAFDMDGTLLHPDGSLSDYAAGVMRAVEKKGVKVVPCTGRPYPGALKHIEKIGLSTIGVFCNGAQLRSAPGGEILEECPLPLGDALLMIDLSLEAGGHPRIYIDDMVYVTRITEEDERYIKRTGSILEAVGNFREFLDRPPLKILSLISAESLPELYEKSRLVFGDRLNITQSASDYLECMHGGATKGRGLNKLASRWGISKEEIVVAGDHLNDLTMFEEAGFSIAPKNAQPAVREAASHVCRSNAEDGVAKKFAEIFDAEKL